MNADRARSWDFFLTAIGIFAAFCAFAASLYLSRSIGSRLEKLQHESTAARAASVLQALDQNVHYLGDYTTGYAMWDDTYQFLESRDPAYLTTNYADSVMSVSPAQLVGIYDLSGTLIYSKALDSTGKASQPPAGLKDLPRLESFGALKKPGEFRGRVEWIGGSPYLLAVCPITDSAGTAPIHGYLLFGSIIGEKVLARIQTLTGVSVSASADGTTPKGNFEIATADLGPAEFQILNDQGGDSAEVFALFREDNSEQHSVLFKLVLPANASMAGREISKTISIVFLLVSAGFAAFVALAIRELRRQRVEIRGRILEGAELLAARQKAEVLAEKAEAADKSKSAFLAMMSHEIRTPLNAIIGYAELLKSNPAEEQAERLNIICKSGGVLQHVLDDILDFSKIEAGKLVIGPHRASAHELIGDAIKTFQNQAASKQIQILSDISDDVPLFLMIDGVRFSQILGNLLSNAIKFTSAGTIRITASEMSGLEDKDAEIFWLRVTVEDEGIGIGADEEQALFQPFSQGDSRVARRHEGTGLGLVICRRLCELMGGRVFFRRRAFKGSAFCFELPFTRAEVPPRAVPREILVAPRFDKNMSILIVDDNAVNARLLEAILKRSGLVARSVLSGQETLELLRKEQFEVIFMDIQMPEMDGLETTARVREFERKEGLKRSIIIAVTADILMSDAGTSLEAGMDGYLSKPVNPRKIEETLARLLQERVLHA